jgi:hypothetical protein
MFARFSKPVSPDVVAIMKDARSCLVRRCHLDAAALYDKAESAARELGKTELAIDCHILASTSRVLHLVSGGV